MDDYDFTSVWQTEKPPEFPKFTGECAAHTVILGGGICGLLCAYELLQNGIKDIVLLEARRICNGTTGYTTAKITSQHGLFYQKLISGMGEKNAAEYARANEEAIEQYRSIIEKEKIDCDFTPCDAFVYARNRDDAKKVEKEAEAAKRVSIDADVVHECELPFKITAALRFPNQAKFHPLKFAYKIAEILKQAGVQIYENSGVVTLDNDSAVTRDGRVHYKNVVLCTHYPFANLRGMYFVRIYQSRSYILALEGAQKLNGMYLDSQENGDSFRTQTMGDKELLLLSRFDHRTGHNTEVPHYKLLEKEAQSLYPGSIVRYHWSAQDCMTSDSIPYIGRYRQHGSNIYLATGFNKWGMTGSMAAAHRISRLIVSGGEESSVFSPLRSDFLMQVPSLLQTLGDVVANFAKGYLGPAHGHVADLINGKGDIVEYNGSKIGAYRDDEGKVHGVKPYCAHMRCPLQWNQEEHTWDCPCHGSRFNADGKVMENPACHGLERKGPD